jgi:hypothetical protein
MNIPRITFGLELVDDSGDEVCVSDIDESSGVVTLQLLDDDDSYTISVRELRSKLRDGEFAVLDPDDSDDGGADEEESDDEDG